MLNTLGAMSVLRPVVPRVPEGGAEKAQGSKYISGVPSSRPSRTRPHPAEVPSTGLLLAQRQIRPVGCKQEAFGAGSGLGREGGPFPEVHDSSQPPVAEERGQET